MIRFLKNVKCQSPIDINLSSFDINAICYDVNIAEYHDCEYQHLVFVLYLQLHKISEDEEYANELKSVDGREFIFRYKPEKIEELKRLLSEVSIIAVDLKEALQPV